MFPFDIASKQAQIQKYEEEINKQDFWDDNEKAQKILQQNSDLKNIIAEFEGLNSIKKLEDKIDEVKIKTLLNGKYDVNNAVLSINAGTGGLDAQDCAQMILRMYLRWADQNNFKVKTLDMISDPEAGIKSVTLLIQGTNAYGYLKSEKAFIESSEYHLLMHQAKDIHHLYQYMLHQNLTIRLMLK